MEQGHMSITGYAKGIKLRPQVFYDQCEVKGWVPCNDPEVVISKDPLLCDRCKKNEEKIAQFDSSANEYTPIWLCKTCLTELISKM